MGAQHWQPLHASDGYGVGRHWCRAPARRDGEEVSRRSDLALVRSGTFVRHGTSGRIVAQPGWAILFPAGEPYHVEHPHGGDECLVLALPEPLLEEALGTARLARAAARPLRVSPVVQREAYALERLAEGGAGALAIEEALLALVGGLAPGPSSLVPARGATRRRHDALVDGVATLLWERLGEAVPLADLAARLDSSPFHLARVFRAATGASIHAYRLALRIHEAMHRLREGAQDISRLAADLGFADHAHLTRTFRAVTGVTPSTFRRLGTRAARARRSPLARRVALPS